jgi:hypothetical protein
MPNLTYDSLANGLNLQVQAGTIDAWHPVTTKQGHRRWEVWITDYQTREPMILTDHEVHVLLVGLVTASRHREVEIAKNPTPVDRDSIGVRAVKAGGVPDTDENASWYASGRLGPDRVVWARLRVARHADRYEAEREVQRLYPNQFVPTPGPLRVV